MIFYRCCLLLFLFCFILKAGCSDNDFSEFDEFEDQEDKLQKSNFQENKLDIDLNKEKNEKIIKDNKLDEVSDKKNDFIEKSEEQDDDEVTIEDQENLEEEEEVENKKKFEKKPFEPMKLSSLPLHLRNNWASYFIELTFVVFIVVYFINFFIGSSANLSIGEKFFSFNNELLKTNFTLVGDTGAKSSQNQVYFKDSDNLFVLWCSGKFGIECCVIELHLLKRQDLVSKVWNFIKPMPDQIVFKFFLKEEAMDNFVFCLANKKNGIRIVKEYNDVTTFCTQRKSIEKFSFLNNNFILLNEIGDVTSLVLDGPLLKLLSNSPELVNFIHISDQFSGLKSTEETQPTKPIVIKKVLTFSFNFPKNIDSSNNIQDWTDFLFISLNLVEKLKRFKLKKDMKQKSISNRKRVDEYYEKLVNVQRQEAAQLKKEEKRRQEKEKILNENDGYKLRKLEEKEYKKELKKKTQRMKQIKMSH